MGCDIHIIIEKKVKTSLSEDVWYCCNNYILNEDDVFDGKEPRLEMNTTEIGNRNYDVFGYIAGVRADKPLFKVPIGIPSNCTTQTRAQYDLDRVGMYAHTPTWYYFGELVDYIEKIEDTEDRILMSAFVKNISSFIFNRHLEYNSDSALHDTQYLYKYCKDTYRIIIYFDN